MRIRRIVTGLILSSLLFAGGALPAQAVLGVEQPPVPTPGQVEALVMSFVPATPGVPTPGVNPDNPQLPTLPYVAPPSGLVPALGVLSPTTVVTCQVAYLGPLGAVVVMTALLDALPPGTVPVQPSFLSPLFSPVVTACVLAPFPEYTACGPDQQIADALGGAPSAPGVPVPGVPSVDPFSTLPAPFASAVVIARAAELAVLHYVYNGTQPNKLTKNIANQMTCV